MLIALFLVPLVSSFFLFFLNISAKRLKAISFLLSAIPFALLCTMPGIYGARFDVSWFDSLSVHLHFYVDQMTYVFLFLTSAIVPISILSETRRDDERANVFYALILLVEALLIGFFASKDLLFFTFFFESMLVTLYFLLTAWGGKRRKEAAFTFIIYMVAGSALMIVSVLALYFGAKEPTFNMTLLAKTSQKMPYAPLVCALFLLAFFVKTPIFPLHAWLADTYCEASTTATILLSALLSKAGIYGILRVGLGMFPETMYAWSYPLICVSIIGVLYGAFSAWAQTDFKRVIAYSSFSHVNFILVGIFALTQTAVSGAIVQAVNHAITICGLFLVAGWLERRIETTSFAGFSGLAKMLPRLSWLTLFFVLSSVALPGLNNFISEIMVLYGLFLKNWQLSALCALTMILSILYMFRWMHTIYFAKCGTEAVLPDIRVKEFAYALPLVALIFWLGLYPAPILKQSEPSAQKLLRFMEKKR